MIALDTNVLARYLLNDDPVQARAASALLALEKNYTAPPTVMLELVWVLRTNGCDRNEILKGLRLLLGLPNFRPLAFEALCYALRWFEEGMDFGDALHLAMSADEDSFITFDKSLGKLANQLGAMPATKILST